MNLNDKINCSRPGHPPVTDAARHAHLTADGSWIDPPHQIIVTHTDTIHDSGAVPGNAGPLATGRTKSPALPALSLEGNPSATVKGHFLIESHERLEIAVTQTKQSIEPRSNRDKITPPSRPARSSLVTRHPPLSRDFLTGTRKQLESPVTNTKQTTEVLSNRDTNTTLAEAD
jgi:hypothetical protein